MKDLFDTLEENYQQTTARSGMKRRQRSKLLDLALREAMGENTEEDQRDFDLDHYVNETIEKIGGGSWE